MNFLTLFFFFCSHSKEDGDSEVKARRPQSAGIMADKKKEAGSLLSKKKKMKPRKSRDADCCSVNFLKCVLHIFNVVFMFAGIGILIVGAWTVATKHRYVALLPTPTYPAIAYLLIVAGAMGVPVCALGLCGLKTENRTSLLCYTYFLLITLILKLSAGGLAYYYSWAAEGELRRELNTTLLRNYALDAAATAAADRMQQEWSGGGLAYYYSWAAEGELRRELNTTLLRNYALDAAATAAADRMQQEFKCCGAINYQDWRHSPWHQHEPRQLVPDSCCKTVSPRCGARDHPSNIHYVVSTCHLSTSRASWCRTPRAAPAGAGLVLHDCLASLRRARPSLQHTLCGEYLSPQHEPRQLVPDSCCKTVSPRCGARDHPSNIHYVGCLRYFTNHIQEHLIILAAVGVGMSVIPIFGFLFSCVLYVKIKHVLD
ncbi:unnamed protein product [Plutella xylostella]|uniref:(diamondback moth) hypothetical protein n=1 Tax=Plutella xylostella TaxID=51655 RepID=A0A8S4D2A9_PLUXY|nr:unnamed protein product [Plutella xylostella]